MRIQTTFISQASSVNANTGLSISDKNTYPDHILTYLVYGGLCFCYSTYLKPTIYKMVSILGMKMDYSS